MSQLLTKYLATKYLAIKRGDHTQSPIHSSKEDNNLPLAKKTKSPSSNKIRKKIDDDRISGKTLLFVSSQPKTGCTTIALSVGKYLGDNDINVCYVEMRKGYHTSNALVEATQPSGINNAINILATAPKMLDIQKITPLVEVYQGLHLLRNTIIQPCPMNGEYDVFGAMQNIIDCFDVCIFDVDVQTLVDTPAIATCMDHGFYVTELSRNAAMREVIFLTSIQNKIPHHNNLFTPFKLIYNRKNSNYTVDKFKSEVTELIGNNFFEKGKTVEEIPEFALGEESFSYLGKHINHVIKEVLHR